MKVFLIIYDAANLIVGVSYPLHSPEACDAYKTGYEIRYQLARDGLPEHNVPPNPNVQTLTFKCEMHVKQPKLTTKRK